MAHPSPADSPRPGTIAQPASTPLRVNGRLHLLPPEAVTPDMPLLWVLRDVLNLTGTRYGCDNGSCGACTVRLDGRAVPACQVTLAALGRTPAAVQTIEDEAASPVLQALRRVWTTHHVAQCGYCDSGVLMAAAALLERTRRPSDADIDAALSHLCPCGATPRFRAAVQAAAQQLPATARPPGTKPPPPP